MNARIKKSLADLEKEGFQIMQSQGPADNKTWFVVLKKLDDPTRCRWVSLTNDFESWSEPIRSDVLVE